MNYWVFHILGRSDGLSTFNTIRLSGQPLSYGAKENPCLSA